MSVSCQTVPLVSYNFMGHMTGDDSAHKKKLQTEIDIHYCLRTERRKQLTNCKPTTHPSICPPTRSRRRFAHANKPFHADLAQVSKRERILDMEILTIQLPHSSIRLVIISTWMFRAASKSRAWMARDSSTISATVLGFRRSSLFRRSKRMFNRRSASSTWALKDDGARDLTRCMSAERIS